MSPWWNVKQFECCQAPVEVLLDPDFGWSFICKPWRDKKKKRLILLVRTHDERKNFNKLREHINAKVF